LGDYNSIEQMLSVQKKKNFTIPEIPEKKKISFINLK